ncbi:MAG: acyl-CoA synthetase (AMP-forming)/AMP-acid ligase II-like protein [Enterovirga sp.]|nr:acyl-CoA synthetase (AMP-forming)/AMP-acid ligase II-like protein [Enterovirga sp.]
MAVVAPEGPHADDAGQARAATGVLSGLLFEAAEASPNRIAVRDQPGRAAWSGRPSHAVSCALMAEGVRRLSCHLESLGLAPGTRVGLFLPNGSEAALAFLAVEHAGLTACLLDVTADAAEISRAIEVADIRALVSQGVLGDDRPAEKLCFVAAGFFRLRFLMAFGPRVPDGVTDLDAVLSRPVRVDPRREFGHRRAGDGMSITFTRAGPDLEPVIRPHTSLLAATVALIAAARMRPGDSILSLVPPDDLGGLASGLVASLIAGATLEAHGLFDGHGLWEALRDGAQTHLVAPGWMEPALAASGLDDALRSVILLHRPPARLDAVPSLPCRTVDLLALGETALLASPRTGAGGAGGLRLAGAADPDGSDLLAIDLAPNGELLARGIAVTPGAERLQNGWTATGYRGELSGDRLVAVS